MNKTNIGLIKFINCLPVNYCLKKKPHENYIFTYGTPAELNKLMKEGSLDIAPVSSFEYIKNKNLYRLIKTACISSNGECGSVLVFSKQPLSKLVHAKIAVPCDSASSTNFLKIILNEKNIDLNRIKFEEHNYACSPEDYINSGMDAVLFIGDNALRCNSDLNNSLFIYDIGKLWKDLTGYPAVFGTWAARENWVLKNKNNFKHFCNILHKTIETSFGLYFNEIVNKASINTGITENIIKDYLTLKIKYNYTIQHEKSLEIFEKLNNNLNKEKERI